MTMAFGTHEAAKEYGRAGFTEAQVEALVNVARRTTMLPDISNLATRSDIADMANKSDINGLKFEIGALRSAVMGEIAMLRSEFKGEVANAKFQTIVILLPGMAAIVAVVTAVSHLLH
jgi:hypothetical protein